MGIKPLKIVPKQAGGVIQEVPGKKQFIFTTDKGKMVFVENAGEGGLYFKNSAGAYNFLEDADSYERAAQLASSYLQKQPDVYGKASNQEGKYFTSKARASRKFAELKDTYLQLLQEGYKPEDVEKFVKDIQKNPDAKSPTPAPGQKPLTTSIGADSKQNPDKKAGDADNFKGTGINKDCKNPKAKEDLDDVKTNNFDKKTCKGSYSAALNYLDGE